MYSQDKIDIALQIYHQCGFVTNPIRMLGYPGRKTLYVWIENEGALKVPLEALGLPQYRRISAQPSRRGQNERDPSLLPTREKRKMCVRGNRLQPVEYLSLAEKISLIIPPARGCLDV